MEAEHERQDSQDVDGTRRLDDIAGRPVGIGGIRAAEGRLGADTVATRDPGPLDAWEVCCLPRGKACSGCPDSPTLPWPPVDDMRRQ